MSDATTLPQNDANEASTSRQAEAELADNLEDLQLTDEAQALLADKDLELDEDAQAMLEELTSSQAEVQSMLAMHRQQADELGGMRDNLALELHELQEEAWKLQLYGELESLKRQLASLQGLEKDLDAAEAVLDATEPGTSPSGALTAPETAARGPSSRAAAGVEEDGAHANGLGGDEDDDDDEEYDPEAINQMQAQLDEELAEMFAQLQAVKAEAAVASARKALLEAELKALLEQTQGDGLGGEEEEDFADGTVEVTEG